MTVTPDRETAYPVTIGGRQYNQQVFNVTSEAWICDYAVDVSFADPDAVPEGTRIVNINNQDITTVTTSSLGNGYGGQFKVLYPAEGVAGESGTVQFNLRADVAPRGL